MKKHCPYLKLVSGFMLSVLFTACHNSQSENKLTSPPNFILIMADDLGYEGLSCYGNQVLKTSQLDQLAQNGLRFSDYHSNGSVCSPTRAALLTGKYQQKSGLEGVIYARGPTRQTGLDSSEITLAKLLKSRGYVTGITGKWHLGYQKKYNPVYHGFDEFFGYVSGNVDYHSHYDMTGVHDWWHNLDSISETGYVTDLITRHSVEFIEKNKDQPFFLYVSHEAPHLPFQGRADPAYRFSDNKFSYYGPVEDTDRAYREMVEVMDEGIGEIMAVLKKLKLEENTLVVFVSDNGGEKFGHNGQLNGSKGSLLEGGHRVPGMVYWKDKIQPGQSEETIMSFDWMPTFLALSNTQNPDSLLLDGTDLSQHLLERTPLPKRNLFWKYGKEKAVRQNQYKLFTNESDTLLFDLEKDLEEKKNIADTRPALVQNLVTDLKKWESQLAPFTQKTN